VPKVLTHLCSALEYLSWLGITHRDVKPDNILVTPSFEFKLADFGTAKYNAAKVMDTFTGTEKYMAPELFETPRRYTSKVDMWAVGLIALQLLTTWDPFTAKEWNPHDFETWVCDVLHLHMDKAPKKFLPLLEGLLRVSPMSRWSAADNLQWLQKTYLRRSTYWCKTRRNCVGC
jgi:serine/threonine protein kinase